MIRKTLYCLIFTTTIIWIGAVAAASTGGGTPPQIDTWRAWIVGMKSAPRGPFSRIRWFCNDGTVLPPKAYACVKHGGGHQHGEWSERTRTLRDNGYLIANILAGMDPDPIASSGGRSDELNQIVIEQFLMEVDDGWIMRKARYYRGALQAEDEAAGARSLLEAMAAQPTWTGNGFLALRTAARHLRHGVETRAATQVRQLSLELSERDQGFMDLRVKIHNRPDREDARRVREYAAGVRDPELAASYETLARLIDDTYRSGTAAPRLRALAGKVRHSTPGLAKALGSAADRLAITDDPEQVYRITSQLLVSLRDDLPRIKGAAHRLAAIDTGLALESDHFVAATELRKTLPGASRGQRMQWLGHAADATYGSGLMSKREHQALHEALKALDGVEVPLDLYRQQLDYLGRAPGWGAQWGRYQFYESMQKLGRIEPLTHRFNQDLLRGSPLFFYSTALDSLSRDANALAGVRQDLFGADVGANMRPLNPGLARGTLHTRLPARAGDYSPDGIYVLPETTSDLPPVAGILTAGEGNPLSHVQLLARNLGIPNVSVNEILLPELSRHDGQRVVLAVSPGGVVRLEKDDGSLDAVFERQSRAAGVLIRPDMEKLDLGVRDFIPLSDLRASDSGRIVGPKAAKLGELKHHYPEAVGDGLAIPFGAFRQLMDQPRDGSGQSTYDWMVARYRRLERMPAGSAQRRRETEAFRQQLQDWILHTDPGEDFRARLQRDMAATFGADGSYGVFVRSDTNVEDLPGFTGAGLNETVPNVVGFDNVVTAISRVWASPFSQRAFAWRQSHMDQPEHVYPAVLLLRSMPSEKSGVMVTRDIDTGDRNWISVAVNEGPGGAVDGQAAESLRVDLETGQVHLLASATTPWRRHLKPAGGVEMVPVSGRDHVLEPGEIAQLIELAKGLPHKFPPIVDSDGNPAPADIEFGFVSGQLRLFQLRPFLESAGARANAYLGSLDDSTGDTGAVRVRMAEVPGS